MTDTTATDHNGSTPLIEARGLSKYFGSVIALQDVSMYVNAGEVLCLLGDNGAGKSTLIKTLSGVHLPDAGQMFVDGMTPALWIGAVVVGLGAVAAFAIPAVRAHKSESLVPAADTP